MSDVFIGLQKSEVISSIDDRHVQTIYSYNDVLHDLWVNGLLYLPSDIGVPINRRSVKPFISYIPIKSMRRLETGLWGMELTNKGYSVGQDKNGDRFAPSPVSNESPEFGLPYRQFSTYIPVKSTTEDFKIYGAGLVRERAGRFAVLAYSPFEEQCIHRKNTLIILTYRVMFDDKSDWSSSKEDIDIKRHAFFHDYTLDDIIHDTVVKISTSRTDNKQNKYKVSDKDGDTFIPPDVVVNEDVSNPDSLIKTLVIQQERSDDELRYVLTGLNHDSLNRASTIRDRIKIKRKYGNNESSTYPPTFIGRKILMIADSISFRFIDTANIETEKTIPIDGTGIINITDVINIGYSAPHSALYVGDRNLGIYRIEGVEDWVLRDKDLIVTKIPIPGEKLYTMSVRYEVRDRHVHFMITTDTGIYMADYDGSGDVGFGSRFNVIGSPIEEDFERDGRSRHSLVAFSFFMDDIKDYRRVIACEPFTYNDTTDIYIASSGKKTVSYMGYDYTWAYYGLHMGMTEEEAIKALSRSLPQYYIDYLKQQGNFPPKPTMQTDIYRRKVAARYRLNKSTHTIELTGRKKAEYEMNEGSGITFYSGEDSDGYCTEDRVDNLSRRSFGSMFSMGEHWMMSRIRQGFNRDDQWVLYPIIPGYTYKEKEVWYKAAIQIAPGYTYVAYKNSMYALFLDLNHDSNTVSLKRVNLQIPTISKKRESPAQEYHLSTLSDTGVGVIDEYGRHGLHIENEYSRRSYEFRKIFPGNKLILEEGTTNLRYPTYSEVMKNNGYVNYSIKLESEVKYTIKEEGVSIIIPKYDSVRAKRVNNACYVYDKPETLIITQDGDDRRIQVGVQSKEYIETGIVAKGSGSVPIDIFNVKDVAFLVGERGTPNTPLICSFYNTHLRYEQGTSLGEKPLRVKLHNTPDVIFGTPGLSSEDVIYSRAKFIKDKDGLYTRDMDLVNEQDRNYYLAPLPVLNLHTNKYIAKIGSKELQTGVYDKYFNGIQKSPYIGGISIFIDNEEMVINDDLYIIKYKDNYIPYLSEKVMKPSVKVNYDLGLILFPDEYAGKTYTVKYRYFRDIGFDLKRVDAIMSMEEIEAYARGEYD